AVKVVEEGAVKGGEQLATKAVEEGGEKVAAKAGEEAAIKSGEQVANKAVEEAAVKGGEKVTTKTGRLVEGGGKILAKELEGDAAEAFAHGSTEISDKVLDGIVSKVAAEGSSAEEKVLLRKLIVDEFKRVAEGEVRTAFKTWIARPLLEAGAGFTGGFL